MKHKPSPPTQSKWTVSNFGPILDANIELRPFTVFVGKSNTGKSYLAILIYAIQKFFSQMVAHNRTYVHSIDYDGRIESFDVSEILNSLSMAVSQSKKVKRDKDLVHHEVLLSGNTLEALAELTNAHGKQLTSTIEIAFGRDRDGLRNVLTKSPTEIQLKKSPVESNEERVLMNYELGSQTLGIKVPEELALNVSNQSPFIRYSRMVGSDDIRRQVPRLSSAESMFLYSAIYEIIHQLTGGPAPAAHYLPADRTAVIHAHQVIVSSALQSVAEVGVQKMPRTGLLTGVQADYLTSLILNAPALQRNREKIAWSHPELRGYGEKYAKMIESDILQGSISVEVDDMINYPSFFYSPTGHETKIPLMNASSMIGELAPLVLYLRFIVRPGDLIIFEEPESHMHPASQVQLLNILAQLVSDGYKILITTHSEWFIEGLSNIVNRSTARESNNQDQEVFLDPKDVGVWLFKSAGSNHPQLGSNISEVCMDEDGSYTTGYEDVAHELYSDWLNITSQSDYD